MGWRCLEKAPTTTTIGRRTMNQGIAENAMNVSGGTVRVWIMFPPTTSTQIASAIIAGALISRLSRR
jgi:hypothetical protein